MQIGQKKIILSLSLSPEIIDSINAIKIPGSFSHKLEKCLHDYFLLDNQLVQYQDDAQKWNCTPVISKQGAERLYMSSSNGSGYQYRESKHAPKIQEIIDSFVGRSKHNPQFVSATVAPALRNAGFIIQIIDEITYDLYDVWFYYPDTAENGTCNNCRVIKEIQDYLQKIKI